MSTSGVDMPLALSILIGDAFHNFCDGVFVGIAFKRCTSSIAMTIVGVTLYHEIAQELADYFLLTRHAGLTKFNALLLNFLAGLSVVLGGLLVLVVDFNDLALGVLLGLASGVYLYIAACECLPRVTSVVSSGKDWAFLISMFALGAIPIGLTLINHTHCEAEGHDDH
jgi:zinc transporter ZupT